MDSIARPGPLLNEKGKVRRKNKKPGGKGLAKGRKVCYTI
jgi:hypothetical protein